MRNRLLLLVACIGLFASCNNKEEQNVTRSLKAEPKTVTFGADDATPKQIAVTAENTDWTYEVADSWVSASRDNNVLTVSVTENTGDEARQSVITISATEAGVESLTITIKQQTAQKPVDDTKPSLSVSQESMNFTSTDAAAQTLTVTVTGGVTWDVLSDHSWIKVSKTDDNTVTIAVENNEISMPRSGQVNVYNTNDDVFVMPVYIEVNQDALDVEPSLFIIDLPDNVLDIIHNDDGITAIQRGTDVNGFAVDIEPKTATWTAEVISGDDWFQIFDRTYLGDCVLSYSIKTSKVLDTEMEAEFVVRHEDPRVEPVHVKVTKYARTYKDSSSTLADDVDITMTKASGRITTYSGMFASLEYSDVELAFYTDDVEFFLNKKVMEGSTAVKYTGEGDVVMIKLYDTKLISTISEGEFVVTEDVEVGTVGAIIPGSISRYSGRFQLDGCSYARIDNDYKEDTAFALMRNGTLKISKSGDVYTFEWAFGTDTGHMVKGSYTGRIEDFDDFQKINKGGTLDPGEDMRPDPGV